MSIEPVAWMDKKREKVYPKEFYNQYKDCEIGSAGFDLIKDLYPLVLKSDYDELQRQLAEREAALRELCLRVAMEVAQNYDGMTIESIVDEVLAE